jgi:arylsulfatase A-like enzyme
VKLGGRRGILLLVLVAGAAAGWLAFQRYAIYIPGILSELRDPIGPNRPVVWQEGPATAVRPPDRRPPNIVVILADDLGYNDLTVNGGGVAGGAVPTRHIDSIARQGVRFSAGYAGNATCAPSRAAIMTGRYATRFGFEFTPAPVPFERLVAHLTPGAKFFDDRVGEVPPLAEQGMPPSEITIAELLRSHGYHTLMLGKWHLGESPPLRPGAQGFDESLAFLPGASKYLPAGDPNVVDSKQEFDPIDRFLWPNLPFAIRFDGSGRFTPGGYMTDYLTDEAVKAIHANRNRPFFMYLAYNAPHTPLQALKSDYDALPQVRERRLRVYAAMIRALDRGVGKVLRALEAEGLADDTLVFFTSDNGGANYIGLPDINHPYRGWKMTFFEGGIHVPFFVKWPAALPQGATYALPVAHVDIFATAAGAAGAPLPADRPMDGVDLLPFIAGQEAGRPHRTLFWRDGGYEVLLDGDWKLQVSKQLGKTWLYDLASDPTEQRNLSDARPEQVEALRAVLDTIDAQQAQPAWPSLVEAPIAVDRPLGVAGAKGETTVIWSN